MHTLSCLCHTALHELCASFVWALDGALSPSRAAEPSAGLHRRQRRAAAADRGRPRLRGINSIIACFADGLLNVSVINDAPRMKLNCYQVNKCEIKLIAIRVFIIFLVCNTRSRGSDSLSDCSRRLRSGQRRLIWYSSTSRRPASLNSVSRTDNKIDTTQPTRFRFRIFSFSALFLCAGP